MVRRHTCFFQASRGVLVTVTVCIVSGVSVSTGFKGCVSGVGMLLVLIASIGSRASVSLGRGKRRLMSAQEM